VMPLLEQFAPQQVGPIRDALSQLQLAFVRIGGPEATAPGGGEPPAEGTPQAGQPGESPARQAGEPSGPAPGAGAPSGPAPPKPGEPGPAQRSGKLWVPGQ
jgi:hypothetical protein